MASARGDQTGVLEVERQDLQSFTNDFSDENLICKAQYCLLYHGKIPQGWKGLEGGNVTVKVWVRTAEMNELVTLRRRYYQLVENFNLEIDFLKSSKATSSCYLPRLIAHGRDDENEFMGVVYDLQSSNALRNFVDKAEFKWLERIKVAVGLARLLKFLIWGEPRYLVRDLSAAHIMLDKDWNPILFNYFMLAAGAMDVMESDTHVEQANFGSYGYIDFAYVISGLSREYSDVFAFGVILCELLFKRKVDHKRFPAGWWYIYNDAVELYPLKKSKFSFKQKKYSFVDKSFEEDPGFNALDGPKLCKLARLCVDPDPKTRPNMKEVVKWLEELHVVRDHVEMFAA